MNIRKNMSTIMILTLVLTSLPVSAIKVRADEDILFLDDRLKDKKVVEEPLDEAVIEHEEGSIDVVKDIVKENDNDMLPPSRTRKYKNPTWGCFYVKKK